MSIDSGDMQWEWRYILTWHTWRYSWSVQLTNIHKCLAYMWETGPVQAEPGKPYIFPAVKASWYSEMTLDSLAQLWCLQPIFEAPHGDQGTPIKDTTTIWSRVATQLKQQEQEQEHEHKQEHKQEHEQEQQQEHQLEHKREEQEEEEEEEQQQHQHKLPLISCTVCSLPSIFTRLGKNKHNFGWFPEAIKFVQWSKFSILSDRISQKNGQTFHINATNINATGVATDIAKVPQWGSTVWKLESCSISCQVQACGAPNEIQMLQCHEIGWRKRKFGWLLSVVNLEKQWVVQWSNKSRLVTHQWGWCRSWQGMLIPTTYLDSNPGCTILTLVAQPEAADATTPPMAASPEVCICHIASKPRLTASWSIEQNLTPLGCGIQISSHTYTPGAKAAESQGPHVAQGGESLQLVLTSDEIKNMKHMHPMDQKRIRNTWRTNTPTYFIIFQQIFHRFGMRSFSFLILSGSSLAM